MVSGHNYGATEANRKLFIFITFILLSSETTVYSVHVNTHMYTYIRLSKCDVSSLCKHFQLPFINTRNVSYL